jgi:hypothetical protein
MYEKEAGKVTDRERKHRVGTRAMENIRQRSWGIIYLSSDDDKLAKFIDYK